MKKRFLPALLALWMALSLLPVQALAAGGAASFEKVNTYEEGQFTDVSPDAWYAGSVRSAYELGLMTGTGEDRFSPDGAVTLAQAVTMAARLHCIFYTGTESFRQGGSPWYAVYVDYAREAGILTEDYPDYGAQATRGQFARLFARALPAAALEEINPVADGAIRDVGADHGNAPEIYLLYRAGVLTGSDGAFRPSDSIQRAEAAAIVTRMAVPDQRVKLPGGDDGGAPAWEGDPALDFTLELLDGSSFTLSEQAGKAVLVNFWATWCGPCVREMPDLAQLYADYGDSDEVAILLINCGESASAVESFLEEKGFAFPAACDGDLAVAAAYNATAIPRTVVFGRDGTVAADFVGAQSYETFQTAIESALED